MSIHVDIISLAKECGYEYQYHTRSEDRLMFSKMVNKGMLIVKVWVKSMTIQVLNQGTGVCFTRKSATLESVWRVFKHPYPKNGEKQRPLFSNEKQAPECRSVPSRDGALMDFDLMPYGKHEGKTMSSIPRSYLLWLYENGKCSHSVREYVASKLNPQNAHPATTREYDH